MSARERPVLFSAEMSDERWRPVPGFEGRYEVSSHGRVMTLTTYRPHQTGLVLRPYKNKKGYQYVSFRTNGTRKSFAVHRLVLEAFAGPCPAGMQVAHGNGDPTDNRVENLRWATSVENHADRRRHGRVPEGEANASARLDLSAVKTIKKLKGKASAYEIAHLACVAPSTIQSIWDGKTWRAA